jgi:4-carboxymuconolactone decarboxylase
MEAGEQVMRDLMGDAFMVRRAEARNGFNGELQDYAAEVCFGRVWARDGIDRKLRSILNIAMLTALNRPNQLKVHVEGALNNGCTPEELLEILLQTAVYCGLPAATEAVRIAEEVLKERNLVK